MKDDCADYDSACKVPKRKRVRGPSTSASRATENEGDDDGEDETETQDTLPQSSAAAPEGTAEE